MDNHIENLIRQGEHQKLDFKFRIDDSKKIARTMSAFSNTDGGILLIGVKDNGVIAGIRSDEELYMIEAAAKMYTRPSVIFSCKQFIIHRKNILEVTIPVSSQKPCMAMDEEGKWKAYIRRNDQNFLANKILLEVWKNENRKYGIKIKFTEKEKFLLDYLEKNEKITFSQFVKRVGIKRFKAEEILVKFISLKIIDIVFTEKQVYYQINKRFDQTILEDYL